MKKLLVLLIIAAIGVAIWRRNTYREDAAMVQTKVMAGAAKAQEKVGGGSNMEAVADLAEEAADDAADAADAAAEAAADVAEEAAEAS